MTANSKHTKGAFATFCTTLASGIQAMPDATFLLGMETLTKAQVVGPLQAYPAQVAKTAEAKTAYDESLLAEHALEAEARAMVDRVKPFLQGRFGKESPKLESQFGIAPQKKPQKTVATKAGAIAKSKATREIRGTKGAKQTKALKAPAAPTPPAPAPTTPALPPGTKSGS
jgi:hypothetical protein